VRAGSLDSTLGRVEIFEQELLRGTNLVRGHLQITNVHLVQRDGARRLAAGVPSLTGDGVQRVTTWERVQTTSSTGGTPLVVQGRGRQGRRKQGGSSRGGRGRGTGDRGTGDRGTWGRGTGGGAGSGEAGGTPVVHQEQAGAATGGGGAEGRGAPLRYTKRRQWGRGPKGRQSRGSSRPTTTGQGTGVTGGEAAATAGVSASSVEGASSAGGASSAAGASSVVEERSLEFDAKPEDLVRVNLNYFARLRPDSGEVTINCKGGQYPEFTPCEPRFPKVEKKPKVFTIFQFPNISASWQPEYVDPENMNHPPPELPQAVQRAGQRAPGAGRELLPPAGLHVAPPEGVPGAWGRASASPTFCLVSATCHLLSVTWCLLLALCSCCLLPDICYLPVTMCLVLCVPQILELRNVYVDKFGVVFNDGAYFANDGCNRNLRVSSQLNPAPTFPFL